MADSKTKIPPPARKKATPPPAEPSLNLTKVADDELVQFKAYVSESLKKQFKHYAVDHNLSAGQLLERVFKFYIDNH